MAEQRTGSCVVCQQREPDPTLEPQADVCGPCRSRLRGQLGEIPGLCAVAAAGPRPELEAGPPQLVRVVDVEVLDDGQVLTAVREHHARPVWIAAGAIPGPPAGPRVAANAGEAPMPISADRHDLLAPARRATAASSALAYPGQDDDQIGHLSAATVLDGWCRDFAETRRESTPRPNVAAQCRYLLDRLDWAYVEHPAVDELAAEVGSLWHALRSTAGLAHPKPELCEGVPCKSLDCDLKTLYRIPTAFTVFPGDKPITDWIECASCGRLLTEEEYQAWVRLLLAAAKRTRSVA